MHNFEVEGLHNYYIRAGDHWLLVHNDCGQFFRGARLDEEPSFAPRPNEYKVDRITGLVKDTHGVSVFDNAPSVAAKGFVPHKIDQSTISDKLRVMQRGNDPHHYEVVPQPGANLTPSEFAEHLGNIRTHPQ